MRPIYILVGALVIIGILVIVLVSIFKPSNNNNTPAIPPVVLADYATETNSVSYMIDGITNAEENHRAVKITISNTSRTLEVISGYKGQVIKTKTYANNTESYKSFLAGLQTVGYIKQNPKNTSTNYLGKCPLGFRYLITTSGIKNVPELLWTTNCGGTPGSFAGDLAAVRELFKNQIPDYDNLVSGISVS